MVDGGFHYKIGPAETFVQWFRPDPINLTTWKNQLFEKIGNVSEYKIWLTGGVLEGRRTWDTDFIITGQIKNKPLLQEIMYQMVSLGFANRLLIDVRWENGIEKYIQAGKVCSKLQIGCEESVQIGACSGSRCLQPRHIKDDFVVLSNKIVKNGETITFHKTANQIHEHLWLIDGPSNHRSFPYFRKKHKIFFENTKENRTYPILFKENTNFFNYVRWP